MSIANKESYEKAMLQPEQLETVMDFYKELLQKTCREPSHTPLQLSLILSSNIDFRFPRLKTILSYTFKMPAFNAGLMFAAVAAIASAAPTMDNMSAASSNMLAKRATCSYTGTINPTTVASDAPGCSSITFNGITVPRGQSLDLSKLTKGTTVTFQGHNTWLAQVGFPDSLLKIGGTDITVTGAAGARLDGQGAQYWDGQGSNGPTPKPKFFAAHNLLGTSAINNLYLLDTPVQAVSINGCNGLKVNKMTIDNKSGNNLAANKMPHNTDGFDIGASSNIVIDGAIVDNQDDCVAINSGTVSPKYWKISNA
jgi:polygalacturonase